MGMPELYAAESQSEMQTMSQARLSSQSYRPAALVILPDSEDPYNLDSNLDEASLGYQYLLGFIPFTRLYFEHGLSNFLTEVSLQSFIAQGFQTFTTNRKNLDHVLAQICPFTSARINVDTFNVNAYDLFLTRKLAVSSDATLQAWVRSGAGGVIEKRYPIEIESSSFKKYALAPSLAYAAESAVVDKIDEMLSSEKIARELKGAAVCRRDNSRKAVRLNFISLPTLELGVEGLADKFYASYGFKSLSISPSSLQRSAQRGIESYFLSRGLPFLSSQALYPNISLEKYNQLDAHLENVEIVDKNISLNISIVFSDKERQGVLLKKSCEVNRELDYSRDGYLFLALENAFKSVMFSAFTQKTAEGIECL